MLALIHVSVFSLFHPVEFTVKPAHESVLVVEQQGQTSTLEGGRSLMLKSAARVSGRNGDAADFVLSVANRITREFHGTLEIRPEKGRLLAIVAMDTETAVASILEGESAGALVEARRAQAVVTRSFLLAAQHRHVGYDFCDTTHCQYMRGVSKPGSLGETAAGETRGLFIEYQGHVVTAYYSADCGGHTRSARELGWETGEYPFFGVECPIKGTPRGHRIGLCQRGAIELARRGMSFRDILNYFFPATTLAVL